jgi:hypothetical protein
VLNVTVAFSIFSWTEVTDGTSGVVSVWVGAGVGSGLGTGEVDVETPEEAVVGSGVVSGLGDGLASAELVVLED